MKKKMETTIVYWGYIGGYWDNGKENGNYPAFPELPDVLCRSRSSGNFRLRVALVERSTKTLGFSRKVLSSNNNNTMNNNNNTKNNHTY